MEQRNPSGGRLKTHHEFFKDIAMVTAAISSPVFATAAWRQDRKVTIFVLSDASDTTMIGPSENRT